MNSEQGRLETGEMVYWRAGMRNKALAGPFVVLSVLDAPLDVPGVEEPLDVIVTAYDARYGLTCLLLDSTRLTARMAQEAAA
ncbi:MAG: hypothetical protein ABFD89_22635 [Bryobacteraceae bacterium]